MSSEKGFSVSILQKATPWLALIFGLIFFAHGTFSSFEESAWKEFWSGLGKTMLAGGVFALLLKSYQLMGVFKTDLAELLYAEKFLSVRKDVPTIWENVSKVMFKNKFPRISQKIFKDVREIYLPTDQVLYYDDYNQTINIELIDEVNEIIKVTQSSEYTIYPARKPVKLNTVNHIVKIEGSVTEFKIISHKINDKNCDCQLEQKVIEDTLKSSFVIELNEIEPQKIETVIEKSYSLKHDNIMSFHKDFIIHNLEVIITLKGVKIDFREFGTLKPFAKKGVNKTGVMKYQYDGLIYPKQGYIVFMSKI